MALHASAVRQKVLRVIPPLSSPVVWHGAARLSRLFLAHRFSCHTPSMYAAECLPFKTMPFFNVCRMGGMFCQSVTVGMRCCNVPRIMPQQRG